MILRPRTLCLAGATLMAVALLTLGIAALYVWLAPRTYSSSARLIVRSKSPQSPPINFAALPLDIFKHDPNITIIYNPMMTSLFEVKAYARDSNAAAGLANQRAWEFGIAFRSRSKADFSIIQQALPRPLPVRPAGRQILTISGIVALNVGLVGIICLIAGFLKGRRDSVALDASPRVAA